MEVIEDYGLHLGIENEDDFLQAIHERNHSSVENAYTEILYAVQNVLTGQEYKLKIEKDDPRVTTDSY